MKKYQQKTKQSSLTTTANTFPAEHGSGSCNMVYHGATGNHIAAILKEKAASSSKSATPSTSPLADIYLPSKEQVMWPFPQPRESGLPTAPATNEAT